MTALPSKLEAEKLLPSDTTAAYQLYDTVLLPAEKAASEATDDDATFRTMLARVVGYLLLYPPSTKARAIVQSEIERCAAEPGHIRSGRDVRHGCHPTFLHHSDSIRGEMTPQLSEVESRDFYESIKERARQGQLDIPRDTAETKDFERFRARVRDNFHCMVSHVGDCFAMQGGIIDEAKERQAREPGRSSRTMNHSCHIIPEALEIVREDVPDYFPINIAEPHSEAFWAILGRFGYENVHDELKGTKIHRLENVMTLAGNLHVLFRSLDMWFEEDIGNAQGNCYRVGGPSRVLYEEFETLTIPEKIQFVANADFPLPDPIYLHIQAACCRIARWSGARNHLERLFWEEVRKMEDPRPGIRPGFTYGGLNDPPLYR